MTNAEIIRRLQKHTPRTAQNLLDDCKLPLQLIGQGQFRDAYQILGKNLVIKVPRKCSVYQRNLRHARNEYAIWCDIDEGFDGYGEFSMYLPSILYFNSKTGIMVLHKYRRVSISKHWKTVSALEKKVSHVTGLKFTDIHCDNMGLDARGKLKFIDLGCLTGGN